MAWIESHQALATHRKTMALEAALNLDTPTAIGHLHLLWWWALDNAPSGDLTDIPDPVIARAAQWHGDASQFVSALVLSRFVDEHPRCLHDWQDYSGRLITKRQANTLRMREQRALHVQRTTSACAGATVPNSTQPNSTQPNSTPSIPLKRGNLSLQGQNGSLPDWVDRGTWDAFLEMRKKQRAAPTEHAKQLLIASLARLRAAGNDPKLVLEQSIQNSWKGVFALKEDIRGQDRQTTRHGSPGNKPSGAFADCET